MTKHHFTMSRSNGAVRNRNVAVTLVRPELLTVTQTVVDEIAAHVVRCEQPEPRKAMRDVSNRTNHRFNRLV